MAAARSWIVTPGAMPVSAFCLRQNGGLLRREISAFRKPGANGLPGSTPTTSFFRTNSNGRSPSSDEIPMCASWARWPISSIAQEGLIGLVGTDGPFTRARVREDGPGRASPIFFVHSSTLMHRQTVLAMGGYREQFVQAEDVDLWIRMAEKGHLMLKIPEPLLLYRLHGESLTMKRKRRAADAATAGSMACGEARSEGAGEPSLDDFPAGGEAPPWSSQARDLPERNGRAPLPEGGPALCRAGILGACGLPVPCRLPQPRSCDPPALRPEDRPRAGRKACRRKVPSRCRSPGERRRAGMRPEHELLLSCVRTAFLKDRTDPPPTLPETVDWNRFVGLCDWHNVVPLVYRALPAVCPGAIPPAAMNRLRSLCHNNTARALFLASELSRILNALESCGVPAYPFKGPALSVMLYGDPARRQSKDLDILVPKERVRKAIDCLDTLGYDAKTSLAGARLAAHRRTEYELQFFRRDGKLTRRAPMGRRPGLFRVRPREARHLVQPGEAALERACLSRACRRRRRS